MGRPVRILIAEGNLLLGQALEGLFREFVRDASVCIADKFSDALAAADEHPDLILIDAWMDGGDAEMFVRRVVQRSPGSVVVVIATAVDSIFAAAIKRAGAAGCIEKDGL